MGARDVTMLGPVRVGPGLGVGMTAGRKTIKFVTVIQDTKRYSVLPSN